MAQAPDETSYGKTAASLGFVSDAQVEECLHIQARMHEMGIDEPLGEILVKKRYLTPPQHQAVLKKLGVHTHPIPGYTLHGRIGQGGMGTVYKATQTSVNRLVAVKVLTPGFGKDPTFVARFFQEARAAGKLSHKNLIAAIDVGEAAGLYYFVMEFVTGRSCREILNKEGPFPEPRALEVAIQMAEALEYIHQNRLVHRDIKPENILLTPDGTVKLCDLGLAKSTTSAEQSLTQTGFAVGTPFFMSPEQCRGIKDIDIRADLYSLGASLYFLLAGRPPFEGQSSVETLTLHMNAPVPDPRKAVPGLGIDFAHVIQKLLAKDREDRYPTPAELLEDLQNIKSGAVPAHARAPSRPHVFHKPPPTVRLQAARAKPRWPWAVGVAAAAALLAGIAAMNSGGGREAPRPDPIARAPDPPPAPVPVAAPAAPPSLPVALARARESSAKDPNDFATLIPLYEKAVVETRGTPHAEETRRVLEGLYKREQEPVDARVRELAQAEDFGDALAFLDSARGRHAAKEWTFAIDTRIADLRARPLLLYGPLREGAVEARRRGAEADVRSATGRVARWGMPELREDLEKSLAAASPIPAAVPTPPPPADAYPKKWEAAARLAGVRDYPAAVAEIGQAGGEEAAADLELLRAAAAVHAETLLAIQKIPRGQKLALRYSDESGAPQRIEEAVFRAEAHRIEFRREDVATLVHVGEISGDSLAETWRTRSPRKVWKDGRGAALLCLLEGDPAAARRHLGDAPPDLPAKYWSLGKKLEEERARPDPASRKKEEEARRRYFALERDAADPTLVVDVARRAGELFKESLDTALVRRNRAAISARAAGGREYVLTADDLQGSGSFRLATPAKSPLCWNSEADADPSKRGTSFVEIAFSVLAETEYRAWAYVGGCCRETLTFTLQAADGPDPAVASPQPVKQSIGVVTVNHSSHPGAKQPSKWGWVPLPLPKYSSAGPRRVRLLSDQQGFSVGYAFVSALKTAPPPPADLEKAGGGARPAVAEPGLVGWWRLDERAGTAVADSTRNRNHGVLKNGPAWSPGKVGGGLTLDGVDDHVRIPDSPSINTISAQVSVAAWVNRRSNQNNYRLVVARQLGTGDENQFWLGFDDNQCGFSVTTSKGMNEAKDRMAPNDEWIHLAGTYDGTTLRLYLNGAEVDTRAHGGALSPSARSLMIGADEFDDAGSVQEVPKAVVDDVRLYNRALAPAEVAALAALRR